MLTANDAGMSADLTETDRRSLVEVMLILRSVSAHPRVLGVFGSKFTRNERFDAERPRSRRMRREQALKMRIDCASSPSLRYTHTPKLRKLLTNTTMKHAKIGD